MLNILFCNVIDITPNLKLSKMMLFKNVEDCYNYSLEFSTTEHKDIMVKRLYTFYCEKTNLYTQQLQGNFLLLLYIDGVKFI